MPFPIIISQYFFSFLLQVGMLVEDHLYIHALGLNIPIQNIIDVDFQFIL